VPRSYLETTLGRAANRFAVGAFSGGLGEFSGQAVSSRGDIGQINLNQVVLATGVGGIAGAALPDVRINGFTSGRNNAGAIYNGLQTRLTNGMISQFQLRNATNAGAANAVKGLYGQAAGTVVDGTIKKAVGQ
jgi:hypothetical protein